jgi:hypothetical protein
MIFPPVRPRVSVLGYLWETLLGCLKETVLGFLSETVLLGSLSDSVEESVKLGSMHQCEA